MEDREFRLDSKNLDDFLNKNWFGFKDPLLETPKNRGTPVLDTTNFPRYNIVSKEDGSMRIELAVAGYSEADLNVELGGDLLIVTGQHASEDVAEGDNYRYKGITTKRFTKPFRVSPNTQIDEAKLKDGILTIFFSPKIIKEEKGITIPINGLKKKPQLLQEGPKEGMEIPF